MNVNGRDHGHRDSKGRRGPTMEEAQAILGATLEIAQSSVKSRDCPADPMDVLLLAKSIGLVVAGWVSVVGGAARMEEEEAEERTKE